MSAFFKDFFFAIVLLSRIFCLVLMKMQSINVPRRPAKTVNTDMVFEKTLKVYLLISWSILLLFFFCFNLVSVKRRVRIKFLVYGASYIDLFKLGIG